MPLSRGGAIIDNPGMRELQLWASEESLDGVFEDISALARRCRFRDCTHTSEPGCAVRDALDQGLVDPSRWESFRKLGAEVRRQMLERDVQAAIAERRKWKSIHKSMRHHPKYQR